MQTRRWLNQSQPQTLVIAVFLLYISAAFTFLFFNERPIYLVAACGERVFFDCAFETPVSLLRLLLPVAGVAAGWGIANERRWAYNLGIAVAALPLVARLVFSIRTGTSPLNVDLIGLMFDVALFALLIHPQSREYQRIWFTPSRRR